MASFPFVIGIINRKRGHTREKNLLYKWWSMSDRTQKSISDILSLIDSISYITGRNRARLTSGSLEAKVLVFVYGIQLTVNTYKTTSVMIEQHSGLVFFFFIQITKFKSQLLTLTSKISSPWLDQKHNVVYTDELTRVVGVKTGNRQAPTATTMQRSAAFNTAQHLRQSNTAL